MDLVVNFLVETVAGLVGVFAGVVLALWIERRRRERQTAEEKASLREELAQSRKLVLSSVVKNTSEAKRLRGILSDGNDPYLLHLDFEMAVWDATNAQFVSIASLEERVALTRFFDQVRRLVRYASFLREVRAQAELSVTGLDEGDRSLIAGIEEKLCLLADDIRIDGVVVVTDFGDAMHKRLLGMHSGGPPAPAG